MPDITMCAQEDCLVKDTCYRSEASGTQPGPVLQSYFAADPRTDHTCDYYWPIARRKGVLRSEARDGWPS